MLERRLRLWSGLVLALWVIPHVINHGLGVFSIGAMDTMREVYGPAWRTWPGTVLLGGSLLTHFGLSLWSLYKRPHLRMPRWEAVQLVMGLLFVPLAMGHVAAVHTYPAIAGNEADYAWVIYMIRGVGSGEGLLFSHVLLVVTWVHMVVGLHFLLRVRAGYRRLIPLLYPLAVVVLVVAMLGLTRAVLSSTEIADMEDLHRAEAAFVPVRNQYKRAHEAAMATVTGAFLVAIVGVFVARRVRHSIRLRRGKFCLTLPSGRRVDAPIGLTILESLRASGIPHAAVCGGRGRCTTCRVSIRSGRDSMDAAKDVEAKALERIGASPDVRLACQAYPNEDLEIVPLLPATATARDANRPGGVHGREQEIVIMFLDLRGSTRLGEEKLPYDVLFILNQFFAEMAAALTETGGHYAQFAGDGLMALYGTDTDLRSACRQSLAGAGAMLARLERLNGGLRHDLHEPLKMGIGIHCGTAIVGTMGPPSAPNFSAIGDNVNVAARLEALTKTEDCPVVVSATVIEHAAIEMPDQDTTEVELRGRSETIRIYRISDPATILGLPD